MNNFRDLELYTELITLKYNVLKFEALKNDLLTAWETRNDVIDPETKEIVKESKHYKILLNASDYINAIDPENMRFLKILLNAAERNHSLCSMAANVRKFETIKEVLEK